MIIPSVLINPSEIGDPRCLREDDKQAGVAECDSRTRFFDRRNSSNARAIKSTRLSEIKVSICQKKFLTRALGLFANRLYDGGRSIETHLVNFRPPERFRNLIKIDGENDQ